MAGSAASPHALPSQIPVSADDLLAFARVVEAGSFTAAAQRLGVPKSTLSRRLSLLERQLGERLLLRTTRRLNLTEFGARVLDHARQVMLETEGAMALAEHRQSRPSGVLRVSMPADIAERVLVPALPEFLDEHPALVLELDLSPRRVDLLAERYDLAVRMGDLPDDAALSARALASLSGGLYASPDWVARHGAPHHPDDLLALQPAVAALVLARPGGPAHPWRLRRRTPSGAWESWEGLPAQRLRANSPSLLMAMAQAGQGVTEVSDLLAHQALSPGSPLVRLVPEWQLPPVTAWAVFPERRLMPAKTRAFMELLDRLFGQCQQRQQDLTRPA